MKNWNVEINTTWTKLAAVCILLLILGSCNEADSGKSISGIPVLSINTNGVPIVNEPKISATMEVKNSATENYNGNIGIEYRGAASLILFPKKSFSIETRDAGNQDVNVALFGFPDEEDWVLQGPYDDKTLIRNVISYELSNQMGMYAPRTKLVEVDINNEYQGVYVFTEKIKRNSGRVAISKLTSADSDPTLITGGYILKIDKTAGDTNDDDWSGHALYTESNSFRSNYDQFGATLNTPPYNTKTNAETYFMYEYPKAEELSSVQKEYIKQYINDFETALTNENFSTSERAYEDYIDVNTFVDFFIMSELSHNADTYRLSTFLYKDRDGKLKMGPLWDMNLCYGADANEYRSSPSTWIYEYNIYLPDDLWLVPFWWQKLMQDPLFKAKVKTRWNALRSSTLSKANIFSVIDGNVSQLIESGAMERNFDTWAIMGVSVPFNGFVGQTYDEEIEYMKNWIDQRLTWMDSQIGAF